MNNIYKTQLYIIRKSPSSLNKDLELLSKEPNAGYGIRKVI